MKLMIAGSRNIESFDFSPYISENVELIITGGALGIDKLAEEYADKNRLSKIVLRPEYNKYRKSAPLKRNDKMIEIADEILIIWDGFSKGTKYTIEKARKSGKNLTVIQIEDNKSQTQ